MKHVGTRKRQWFLKVELVILVCLACFWTFKSGSVDTDGVKAGVRSANTPATTQADPLAGDKGGDADAQYNLGLSYDNGQDVHQNYKEAVKCCTSASPNTVSAEPTFDFTPREITPSQIIGDQWNLIHKHFLEREKHLKSQNMSIDDYSTRIEQFQAKLDDEYLKHKSKLNELVQIQKLIDADMISPEHGFRAQWRIALSDKMYEAMFP